MPRIECDQLHKISLEILKSEGSTSEEANIVSEHLIAANMAGHDSHGIIQVPVYVDRMRNGDIVPNAPFEIINETANSVTVDGNWGFGFVMTERTMRIAIDKAKENNVAAATVAHQSHIGRLTDYGLMAAREGMIGLMTADSGRTTKHVAPFGGREPRLGTNPICMSLPSNLDAPVYFDFATSAVAANKLKVASVRGQSVQEGLILDKDGNESIDPAAYFDGGTILPVGGSQGHKGYGLGFMVEVLTSLLTGLGFGHYPPGRHNDGVFMAAFNVEAFRPLKEFKQEVTEFAQYVKSSAPASGVKEVFYPGEMEWSKTQESREEGIFVDDATWEELKGLITEHGLENKVGL